MDIERCRDCRYPLTGLLNDARCPECGCTEREDPAELRLHRRSGPAIVGVCAVTVLSCLVHPVVALVVPTAIVLVTAIVRRDGRQVLFGLGFVAALAAIPASLWLYGIDARNLAALFAFGCSMIAAIATLIDTPPVRPSRVVPVLAVVAALFTVTPLIPSAFALWHAHRDASALIDDLATQHTFPANLDESGWRTRGNSTNLSYESDAQYGYILHIWATDENVAWRYDPVDGWTFIADRFLWWD